MAEEKKPKNEFGEDISWKPDSQSSYALEIQGPVEAGQIARVHNHTESSKKDEEGHAKEERYVDAVSFGKNGNGNYSLKIEGEVTNARIVRMHSCDDC